MASKIRFYMETDDPKRIAASLLRSALDDFVGLLGEVEAQVSNEGRRVINWDITDLKFGSALIEFEAITEDEDLQVAEDVIANAISGLQIIADRPSRPEYFTDEALERARGLTRLLGGGVSRITVSSADGDHNIQITEHIAGNIRQILEHTESYGSVEGALEVLSSRGSLHFSIRDQDTSRLVRCNFDEELVEFAIEAWRNRVVVFGRIRSDNQGRPRIVWVWKIAVLRGDEELPGIDRVRGIDQSLTGGLSSEDYVRQRYGKQ